MNEPIIKYRSEDNSLSLNEDKIELLDKLIFKNKLESKLNIKDTKEKRNKI